MSTPPPPGPQEPAAVPEPDDRNWAVAAHLSALIGFVGVPSLVGPLVVWLVKRDQHPFIGEHAREALNFNLSLLIYVVVGTIVVVVGTVVTLGVGLVVFIPAAIAVFVLWLVFLIQASMHAARGQTYRYPLTIRLVS